MSSSVEDWLRSLGFIHYTQAFLDNGYDELEICKEIGKEDLDAIGVRNFKDRTDILNAVARLKQTGTAIYFVLEGNDVSENFQAQPERETYPPIQLKMMLRDKLEEDKIDLTTSPYSQQDGTEGTLDTLVTIYADKFYTYEDNVLTALRSLRQRQAEKQAAVEDPPPQPLLPHPREKSKRHSSKHKKRGSQEKGNGDGQGSISEDDQLERSVFTEDNTSPKGTNPADYLDVDSPAEREKKSREKKRRKVERNTKLSRSLDSLKELHVNIEPRDRESSSFKSKPFRFKWLQGSKKKHHSVSESKKQALEKRPSNPTAAKDYDLLASAIKMGEEDRKALMILVKQGELTVEEAVEQLKRYEEDCSKEDYIKAGKDDVQNDDEKSESKPKLKRGLFGKSTKRKSGSRPSSEVIACEMTMSEDDRINLMRSVKSGDLTVDEALKRFISYEEKHKKSDSDDSTVPVKQSPRLPKSVSRFSRISIKRVSGVFSSSVLSGSNSSGEANSVFYTSSDDPANADGRSVEGSVSSGDEVVGTDSPVASPKTGLANQSQHSSSSSVDSVGKTDDKTVVRNAQHQPLNFLSEMKVVLEKQARPEGTGDSEGAVRHNSRPPPPPPTKTPSASSMETQTVVPSQNPNSSSKRTPPQIPHRPGLPVAKEHRLPPPVPSRLVRKNSNNEAKDSEINISEPRTDAERPDSEMSDKTSVEINSLLEPGKLEAEPKGVALRRPKKPPPLPPRPLSTSFREGTNCVEGRSAETQANPTPSRNEDFVKTLAIQISSTKPSVPNTSETPDSKPELKPKPKPKPRPRPKMDDSSGKDVSRPPPVLCSSQDNIVQASDDDADAYNEVPAPRPVKDDENDDAPYHQVPPPRPVQVSQRNETLDFDDDQAYNEVPPPRPVQVIQGGDTWDSGDDNSSNDVPPPRPVRSPVGESNKSLVPRPAVRDSAGVSRTRGESSSSDMQTSMEREQSEPVAAKGTVGDKLPVPTPRIKRVSHSLGEMVERKLYVERIDLTQEPYSDHSGCWGVPVNLVDRYVEELHRSHAELAGIMDKLRVRRLKQAQRQAVPCNISQLDFTRDSVGNLKSMSDWLTSLGLPMYIKSLAEVEYDDMESMPYMEERHFQFAGISDERHMRRLLASVAKMPR